MYKIQSLLIVFLAAAFPMLAAAQPLADHVPDDALVYLGWSGTDNLGSNYAGSHMAAIAEASQVGDFLNHSVPEFLARLSAGNMDLARMPDVWRIMHTLRVHPSAIYFNLDANKSNPPKPMIAVLCDAGADAPAMMESIEKLMAQAPAPQIQFKKLGSVLVVSNFDFPQSVENPLSQNRNFTDAMSQLGKEPVMALYVDTQRGIGVVDALIQQNAPPQAVTAWNAFKGQSGIDDVKRFALTSEFEGKDWVSQAIVVAPAPRHGIFAGGEPISQELLKQIPQNVVQASAATFNLGGFIHQVVDGIESISPQVRQQTELGVSQINAMLGFDVQADLLDQFGSQWGEYIDPDVAGYDDLGATLINLPKDPARLEKSIARVEQFLNMMAGQQLRHQKITVQFRTVTSGSTT